MCSPNYKRHKDLTSSPPSYNFHCQSIISISILYRGYVRYRKLILRFKTRTEDSHASSEIIFFLLYYY